MCELLQSVKEQITEIENEITANKYQLDEPNLIDMPVEIFLQICSFLDAYFLKNTLSKVCLRFCDILADDQLWKHWVQNKIKGKFPPVGDLKKWNVNPADWQDLYIAMEIEKKTWCNVEETMKHMVVKDVHFASVDAVLLVNNGELCISGGRDRGMALWNVSDISAKSETNDRVTSLTDTKPKHLRHDAHAGWVWDLAADVVNSASKVYSASWDNTVKAWDLATGFQCIQTFQCGMAALSVVTVGSETLAGLYSKNILSFDLRSGSGPIYVYTPHKGPVLGLDEYDNLIASISEDKTLAVWDRRAGKILMQDIKIPTGKAYPVCLSWGPAALYIGDSKGALHLFNPETLKFVHSVLAWPQNQPNNTYCKVTACHQSESNLILCSDKGEIKFMYNCYPPQEFTTVTSTTSEVTQLQYLNGVLVIGTCDSALEFWVPKDKFP